MEEYGTIIGRALTARMTIPVEGAYFSVMIDHENESPELIGFRVTDENGTTSPVSLQTPDEDLSTQPSDIKPFTSCTLRMDHPLYQTILVYDAQVFANTVSVQNFELIPLEENPAPSDKIRIFPVTPQNL